jgi:hypothetical protein
VSRYGAEDKYVKSHCNFSLIILRHHSFWLHSNGRSSWPTTRKRSFRVTVVRRDLSKHWRNNRTVQAWTEFEISLDKLYREKIPWSCIEPCRCFLQLFNYGRHAATGNTYIDIVAENITDHQFVRQIIIDFWLPYGGTWRHAAPLRHDHISSLSLRVSEQNRGNY